MDKTSIQNKLAEFHETLEHDAVDRQLQVYIQKFDQLMIKLDATWGVDGLFMIQLPEDQEKWRRQMEKFNNAILERDLIDVDLLLSGVERAVDKFQKYAAANGHTPTRPDYVEMKHPDSGDVYRICITNLDARKSMGGNVNIWTLEEVVRVISKHKLDFSKYKHSSEPKTKSYAFQEDEIPF